MTLYNSINMIYFRMINISKQSQLSIMLADTNKALKEVLKDATPQEIEHLSQGRDLKSIINTILKQSANNNLANTSLLELVKNNPTLKNLGDISQSIKELLSVIKLSDGLESLEVKLKNFLRDITTIDGNGLKQKFENSGVFLESRLKHHSDNIKEILSDDLKSILLHSNDEIDKSSYPNQKELAKHIDKLLLHVDYYQLLSHLSNSSCLYLPYSWDLLEKANIKIKNIKDNKFYCEIDLELKVYGEINLKLTLYEKNQLNVYIYSNNKEFKNLINENIESLRSSLIDTQIKLREIRLFKLKKKKSLNFYSNLDNLDIGFEVKV